MEKETAFGMFVIGMGVGLLFSHPIIGAVLIITPIAIVAAMVGVVVFIYK